MICNIHHFGITVKNFDAMVAFYRNAFGFEMAGEELDFKKLKAERTGSTSPSQLGMRAVMMKAGNCFLEIMHAPIGDLVSDSKPHGYVQMCVEVENIDQEYIKLKNLGVTFRQPAPVDFGYLKAVTGEDPEGNQIELEQMVRDWDCNLPKLLAAAP